MLWLWCRPAATALTPSMATSICCRCGKRERKKEREREREKERKEGRREEKRKRKKTVNKAPTLDGRTGPPNTFDSVNIYWKPTI